MLKYGCRIQFVGGGGQSHIGKGVVRGRQFCPPGCPLREPGFNLRNLSLDCLKVSGHFSFDFKLLQGRKHHCSLAFDFLHRASSDG